MTHARKKFMGSDLDTDFNKNKSKSTWLLPREKSTDELDKVDGTSSPSNPKVQVPVPLQEALFLPDFPKRGDIEEQDFEIVDIIAKGAFGNVVKVQREDDKKFYAMKVLIKTQIIVESAIQQVKDEAAIQSILGDHPFIVKCQEYWQSRKHVYIVLEYVPHGDMFTLWTYHGYFPESLVKLYVAEMAMVLDYLHKSGVIYRDIKMENILFDANGHIKLTDFGLAKWLGRGEKTRTICGTLLYMAPEILAVYPYGHTADWWSLGILMYAMLVGKYPVDGAKDHVEMAQKVLECDYLCPSFVSDKMQDVVNKLLMKSPSRRVVDLFSFQNTPLYQKFDFTTLIEKKICPRDVVPEDFFPMTGVSYSYAQDGRHIYPQDGRHNDLDDDSFPDWMRHLPSSSVLTLYRSSLYFLLMAQILLLTCLRGIEFHGKAGILSGCEIHNHGFQVYKDGTKSQGCDPAKIPDLKSRKLSLIGMQSHEILYPEFGITGI